MVTVTERLLDAAIVVGVVVILATLATASIDNRDLNRPPPALLATATCPVVP